MNTKVKIAVGISGGVDSSVAAAILLQEGYEVIGVHLICYSEDVPFCTSFEDREMAVRVATHLDIPFKILDLRAEYKERVIDYMVGEYQKFRTPNPDVLCNSDIKFDLFYQFAQDELGADLVSTGHYARVDSDGNLRKAVDESKDQSYFLATVQREVLKNVMFPLGELKKSDVRKLAYQSGLPTANRPDSQGICFVGEAPLKDFLEKYIELVPGKVVNKEGEVVGTHSGLPLYTIGQRHGFHLHGSNSEASYVISKNPETNELVVGGRQELKVKSFKVKAKDALSEVKNLTVRIRHLGECVPCEIEKSSSEGVYVVRLIKPIESVAAGQIAVFYKKDLIVGAGVIEI